MMELPIWLDYVRFERAAASRFRELQGPGADWGETIAAAQNLLLRYQDDPVDSEEAYRPSEAAPAIAAARILDTAALVADTDGAREVLALHAAAAFALTGNFAAASATILSTFPVLRPQSPIVAAAIAAVSPALAPNLLRTPFADEPHQCRDFIEALLAALRSGQDEDFDQAVERYDSVLDLDVEPWEGSALIAASGAFSHIRRLSLARILAPDKDRFPDRYVDLLLSDHPLLMPPQYRALHINRLIDQRSNAIVALPTGTGKTLLGELALTAALGKEPGLVCYVAPYVALATQVSSKLRRHLPRDIAVHRLVGGFLNDEALDPTSRQNVVVATPERFDALLRNQPDLMPHLRCVVIDEFHLVENGQRGARLEGIISRLLMYQKRYSFRLVALSAVVGNFAGIAEWLNVPTEMVVQDDWRPSARRLLTWSEGGAMTLYLGDDPVRRAGEAFASRLATKTLPWPETNFYAASNPGAINKQEESSLRNTAYLIGEQYHKFQQPILCICGTRAGTRVAAIAASERFPQFVQLPSAIQRIVDLLDRKYPWLRSLRRCLLSGVAYHNSALPADVKDGIESAVDSSDLRAVCATTTLAEGVDLPFRVTILADWLVWDGETRRPMSKLLFRNISGRCGRPTRFTEGDTIVVDNPAGPSEVVVPYRRQELQRRIFLDAEPPSLESTLSSKVSESSGIHGVIEAQLLAAISEQPDDIDVGASFLEHSLARRVNPADFQSAESLIRRASATLLSEDGGALARAASPLRLTPLGQVGKQASVSGGTIRALWKFREDFRQSGDGPGEAASRLLRGVGTAPEQAHGKVADLLAKKKKSVRFVVKDNDLAHVFDDWLSGLPVEGMFLLTQGAGQSTHKPPATAWIAGEVESDAWWPDQFDYFVDFVEQTLKGFVPWMFRTLSLLEGVAPVQRLSPPWSEWATLFEFGVDSKAAAELLQEGAPCSRRLACVLIREAVDGESQTGVRISSDLASVRSRLPDVLGRIEDFEGSDEGDRLREWLVQTRLATSS